MEVVFTLISIHFWSQSIVLFGATVARWFFYVLLLANSGLSRLLVWNSVYGHPKHLEEKFGPLKTAVFCLSECILIWVIFHYSQIPEKSDSQLGSSGPHWSYWAIFEGDIWSFYKGEKNLLGIAKASCWYPDAVGLQRSGIRQLVEIDTWLTSLVVAVDRGGVWERGQLGSSRPSHINV